MLHDIEFISPFHEFQHPICFGNHKFLLLEYIFSSDPVKQPDSGQFLSHLVPYTENPSIPEDLADYQPYIFLHKVETGSCDVFFGFASRIFLVRSSVIIFHSVCFLAVKTVYLEIIKFLCFWSVGLIPAICCKPECLLWGKVDQ